jgi:glutaredoxin
MFIEIMKTRSCPYCPAASRIVKKVADEFSDKVKVREIYLDEDQKERERAIELGISSVPIVLIDKKVWKRRCCHYRTKSD